MKLQKLKRTLRFCAASLAFGAALGIAAGARAAAKPLAIWNGDFANGLVRGAANWTMYTYNHDITDGVVTIDSSSAGGLIVETGPNNAISFPVSVVMAMPAMPVAAEGGKNAIVSVRAGTTQSYDTATYDNNIFGALLDDQGCYQAMWQAGTLGDPTSNTYPTDGSTHWFTFIDRNSQGSGGVTSYLDGSQVLENTSLKSSGYPYARAITVGGLYGSTNYRSAGMQLSYLAIIPSATAADVDYWRLSGMTSAENVASSATSFTGGSGVGVNLNGGTISVTSGQSAYAMFVQDNTTLEIPGEANALAITKPLYVADGKTLTIKLTSLPAATGYYKIVSADSVFGDVVVDTSAVSDIPMDFSVGADGIYISYRRVVYWNGGASGDWGTASNWRLADNTVPSAAPNDSTQNAGDHVIFNDAATVSIGNRQAVVSRITLNADVTFVGRSLAGANGLFFDVMDGAGKLTLNGVWLAIISENAGRTFTIYNDVCIAGDCYFNGGALVNHIYGDLTGSAKLAYHFKGNDTGTGLWLHGDNSQFEGEIAMIRDSGAYSRLWLDGSQASSANAIWDFTCYNGSGQTSTQTRYVFTDNDSTYYFGGMNGGCYIYNHDVHMEIGGRSDYASSFELRTHGSRPYGYITKVGDGTLTLNGYPYHLTLKGGTTTLGTSFEFETYGARTGWVTFDGTGASLVAQAGTDISANIKDSTSAIAFDSNGNDFTWATALAASNVGGLTKKGAGTLTLSAIPQYSGATRVEAGSLVVPLGTQLGDVYVEEGATLTFDLANTTMTGALATYASKSGNGDVTIVNAPEDAKIMQVGGMFMVVNGARTLTWAGPTDTDYSWSTASNWTVGGEPATAAPSEIDDVVFNTASPGVTLSDISEALSITAPNGLTLATAYDLNVYGDVSVTGAFIKEGKGKLAVEGSFSATGGTTVKNGAIEANLETAQVVALEGSSAYANSVDMTANGYGAKFITPNANLLTVSGCGVVEADASLTVSAGSFTGNLTGGMNLAKTGDGTFKLFGAQAFTGNVAVNGGTLKLITPLDVDDLRADFDASIESTISEVEDTVRWHDATRTSTAGAYLSNDSTNPSLVEDENIFGGRKVLYSDSFKMNEPSSVYGSSNLPLSSFFVVQNTDGEKHSLAGDKSNGNWGIVVRNANRTNAGLLTRTYNTYHTEGVWGNGALGVQDNTAGGPKIGGDPAVVTVVRPWDNDSAGTSGSMWIRYKTSIPYIGGSANQAFAEYLTYNRELAFDEKVAVEQYLMAKWGINGATYSVLPATADVTVSAGATLDLGGQNVAVASLDIAGTIQNGTLVVNGNNLTIGSGATITATIKVAGYNSSMVAPTGFEYSDNGDGTATVVDVRSYTWTATNGGNWSDAASWNHGSVPTSRNSVVFPAGEYNVFLTGAASCASMVVNGTVTFAQTGWDTVDNHNAISLYGNVTGEGTVRLHHVGFNNASGAKVTFAPSITVWAPSANNDSDSWFAGSQIEVTGDIVGDGVIKLYDAAHIFSGEVTINRAIYIYKNCEFSGGVTVAAGKIFRTFDALTRPVVSGSLTLGQGAMFDSYSDYGFTFNNVAVTVQGSGATIWLGNSAAYDGASAAIDGTGFTVDGYLSLNATQANSITVTAPVTLATPASTLTLVQSGTVSSVLPPSPAYTVSGPEAGATGTFSVAASGVVPGTPMPFDTEEAANAATVVLMPEQETQGLETNYYKTEVAYNSETGKYVVTAVLDEDEVAPELDTDAAEPVVVVGSTVTMKVKADSLKTGLYYGLKLEDGNGNITHTSTRVKYDGTNADAVQAALTAALPGSGVLYYTIEASDTATVTE